MKKWLHISCFLMFIACSSQENQSVLVGTYQNEPPNADVPITVSKKQCIDSIFSTMNIVSIQSVDSSILVDAKYTTKDNFMHQQLYQHIQTVYLQKEVAQRLAKVQRYLKTLHPQWSLLVYDGTRPVDVQQRMWNALDSIPVHERVKFVSNPKNHSVHNYGAAIDLTIVDERKVPIDMGAGYDDIRKIAYPSLEAQFLASGELTQVQVNNRILIRKVMKSQGFINIPSEWWHFNAFRRDEVKQRYQVVLTEPSCE